MEYVLKVDKLTKKYGKFVALDKLDMTVPKGAIYGLIGQNGAGKTTLMRIICGLQKESGGEYKIYGKSSKSAEVYKARKRMGAVVENPSIYTDMTAMQNLLTQYKLLGIPDSGEIKELLELVGLEKVGSKKAKNYSLGMRQRLGIAVALAGHPDLLILDEPINGLDPQGIVEMRELILRLNREKGITIIISSHILDELSKLATHYGFIDHGHMLKEISSKKLEKICRKCKRLEVSDVQIFSRVMYELELEHTVVSDSSVDLYGEISVSELVLKLYRQNCEVFSVENRDATLESYYINLIGGAKHV